MWTAASLHLLLISALTAALVAEGTAGRSAAAVDAVTLYTEGGWLDQIIGRLEWFPLYRAEAVFILPLSVAMFLLGGRLVRAGLFEPRGRALRRRMIWLGLAVLPLDLLIGSLGDAGGLVFARHTTAPVVALGLLGVTACLIERRAVPGSRSAGWPRSDGSRCRATYCRTSSAACCATAGDSAWHHQWATRAPGGRSRSTRPYAPW